MKYLRYPLLALPLAFAVACGDDETDPEPGDVNPEEVITTVELTMTPMGGGTPVLAVWTDPDGDGAMSPTISNPAPLAANTTYTIAVRLLDETDSPPENITEEIEEEAEEHLFFYEVSGGVGQAMITDRESQYENGNMVGDDLPVGLDATLTTAAMGMGQLRVVLKHLPPASDGTPVKTAMIGINDGETDVDVTFDITVQ